MVSKKQPEGQKKIAAKLEKQSAEYLAGWQRCKADFENYKKRQEEWGKELRLYANETLLLEILPAIDNFELALDHIPRTNENKLWGEGILHIKKQLEEILMRYDVKEIKVNLGDPFDPYIHDCLERKDASCLNETDASQEKKDVLTVKKIVRRGYMLGEKILRPAQVVIDM